MNYRNVGDLSQTIARKMHLLPRGIDLIVGVPRSGILAGIILALMKNIRFTDLDALIEGRLSSVGSTKNHTGIVKKLGEVRHALVIDDSLNRGYAMKEAKERLSVLGDTLKLTFAAVYVVPDAADEVDLVFEKLALPRLFEWNFSHHSYLSRSCVNMDGVIWDLNPSELGACSVDASFLASTSPMFNFTALIGCLTTALHERYRKETEAWLKSKGINYGRLVMRGTSASSGEAELTSEALAAETYRESAAILLIESDIKRAARSAQLAGKPVLAVKEQQMLQPDRLALTTIKQKFRNIRINSEISHSPLVNREAFRRMVRKFIPKKLISFLKSFGNSKRRLDSPN